MNLNQPYEIIVENENPKNPNITVEAEGEKLKISLNGFKLFNTLANKDGILVALNDKLTELTQKHLKSQAQQETELAGVERE